MNKNFFAGLFVCLGLLAIVAFKPSESKPVAGVQKWEYLEVNLQMKEKDRLLKLNEAGSQGWDLVAVEGIFGYFKRPIEQPPSLSESGFTEFAELPELTGMCDRRSSLYFVLDLEQHPQPWMLAICRRVGCLALTLLQICFWMPSFGYVTF